VARCESKMQEIGDENEDTNCINSLAATLVVSDFAHALK
jgi:hypothetical protein